MATYSAFFSSGLLAPRIARCTTPVRSSSPMATSASPVDPVDRQLNLTSTAETLGQISPCPKAPEALTNPERSRTRRRRSSINISASPMALIKSPVRSAGAALQRIGFMSPTRHRAASVSANAAHESNSLLGRLRSGSVGGIAHRPKRLRRTIRCPVPLAPPPSAPLPALPPSSSPTARCGGSLLPPVVLGPIPRQPLVNRSSRAENIADLFSLPLPSPTSLSLDCAPRTPFKMPPSLSSSCHDTIDEVMQEY